MSKALQSPETDASSSPKWVSGAQISDAELARYADLIYSKVGVRIGPHKKTLLSNRLRRRLRETGIDSFAAYYAHLRRLAPRDPEWDAFLQEITTHETYLFRDELQWTWFRGPFLDEMVARGRTHPQSRRLKIWSAACSTGDELFTCACCMAGRLPTLRDWDFHLLGTDIGVAAVEQARRGRFSERAMRLVPAELRRRYFKYGERHAFWEARPALVEMVRFRQHNLLERMSERNFDLVFLKNVLIYFDTESKKRALRNVVSVLRPGGYLVLGPAEGVSAHLGDLTRIHPWLYRVGKSANDR